MQPAVHAATDPDKLAMVHTGTGETRTYAELEANSTRIARYLRERGLAVGDVVAFLADNCPQTLEIYWACLRSGLYATGVNHHLTEDEIAYILADCQASVLFVTAAHLDAALAVCERVPSTSEIVLIDGEVPQGATAVRAWGEILAETSAEPLGDQPRGGDMLYSSGTTGRPKGIKAPLNGMQLGELGSDLMTEVFGMVFSFTPDTVYCSPAPQYHAAPLRYSASRRGRSTTPPR